jgi:TIR domain
MTTLHLSRLDRIPRLFGGPSIPYPRAPLECFTFSTGQPMSPKDSAKQSWSRIATACGFLIPLAQRDTGLWAFPTNYPDGRQAYAAPGTKEEKDRLSGPFGFESITITWNALEAIDRLFSHRPVDIFEFALADIADCRKGDAFGSRSSSYQGSHVNPSTRHTALAVLSFLSFGRGSGRKQEFNSLERTVRWVLSTQKRKTGGWAFDQETRKDEEPMSMASCIAALSCFVNAFVDGRFLTEALRNKIDRAVKRGFDRLIEMSSPTTLWNPRYEETHVVDNAFVFDMLNVAVDRGSIGSMIPNVAKRMRDVQQCYIEFALTDGWPEKPGGKEPALAATINALFVVEHLIPNSPLVSRATDFVFNQILHNDAGAHLKGWDWIMLGRLAARHHTLSEAHSLKIVSAVRELQIAVANRRLSKTGLDRIPREARAPSIYILTRGHSEDIGKLPAKRVDGGASLSKGVLDANRIKSDQHEALGARRSRRSVALDPAKKEELESEGRPAAIKSAHEPATKMEYFVSYAWGDDSENGREREAVVNRFCDAAAAKGVTVIRDKTAMQPGDRISKFMERIGRGDRVLIVLSDKYIKSTYCMTELFEVWRNCREEDSAFIARTRVYVTPCAKIGTLTERTKYVLHWREKFAEMDAQVKEHGLGVLAAADLTDYRRMETFVGKTSDMLRLVKDVLRPGQFEEFLEYGFNAP